MELAHDKLVSEDAFLKQTAACIRRVFDCLCEQLGDVDAAPLQAIRDSIEPGKMLRTRLALALAPADEAMLPGIIRCCAATELIHTATLFHDDVIDGASLRRGQSCLWKMVGQTGAILLGDLFFAAAVELVIESGDIRRVSSFVGKVREVCGVEAMHELVLRGRKIDVATSRDIARGKTGGLFAFPAEVCGGNDSARTAALSEAGYLIGAAYQIADDLIDEFGDEHVIGKTLGTDRKRRKYTIAQAPGATERSVLVEINELSQLALDQLKPWPTLVASLKRYIEAYLTAPMQLHYQHAG